jgi:hypothetical protein
MQMNGKLLASLGDKLGDYQGKLVKMGYIGRPLPADGDPDGVLTEALGKFVTNYGLAPHGTLDLSVLDKALRHADALAGPGKSPTLTGRVLMEYGVPASALRLQLQARQFGGDTVPVGVTVTTDDDGLFALPFDPASGSSLEVVATGPDDKPVVLSRPIHGLKESTALALIAPRALQPPRSEFDRLSATLLERLGPGGNLGLAREDPDGAGHSDLSNLAAETGWDARILALGAQASKLAGATGLPFSVHYALARAGMPNDLAGFAASHANDVKSSLLAAREKDIAPLSDAEIATALRTHASLAQSFLLKRPLNDAGTPVAAFIDQAAPAADAERFKSALFEYAAAGDSGKSLWDFARERQVSEGAVARLKFQGQLAAITKVNLDVMGALLEKMDPAKPVSQLAAMGLFKAEAWREQLDALAVDDAALERLLPPAPAGVPKQQRMQLYAQELARQVRRTYPTESIIQQIKDKDFAIAEGAAQRVVNVLESGHGAGFRLGSSGITSVTAALDGEPQAKAALLRLHALYQVTPDDETMATLWKLPDIKSAFDIADIPKREWLARLRHVDNFELMRPRLDTVYEKAKQVTNAVTAFYGAVHTISTSAGSASPVLAGRAAALAQSPTLAALVKGDLAECEHCRSVLSPAAYFVDLLTLLDPPEAKWQSFLETYYANHGTAYPFGKPFAELDRRRPDLANLTLDCENTNTRLPYIDVVNEILESLVAGTAIGADADIGEDEYSSDELVAEPRRLNGAAYEKLVGAVYPVTLPLDLAWEKARASAMLLDLRPGELAAAFGSGLLFKKKSADQPAHYEAALERLGLSPASAEAITGERHLGQWHALYGYADKASAIAGLSNAGVLADRLQISPAQLMELVHCQFINPRLDALVTLQKLRVPLADVVRKRRGPPLSAVEKASYSARLAAANRRYAGMPGNFDAQAWIDSHWQSGDFDAVLMLSERDPGGAFNDVRFVTGKGDAVLDITWLRLNQFVRLMRHFDWSAAQTDQWLTALYPGGIGMLKGDADWAMRSRVMLIQLDRVRQLEGMLATGGDGAHFLQALWGPMGTTGIDSLYARVFLRGAATALFDHPEGKYLSDAKRMAADHVDVLGAHLQLDEASIRLLLPAAARLDLALVSSLYRHAQLARALDMPVADLLDLQAVSGIDPSVQAADSPVALAQASEQTMRFVALARTMRAVQLSVPRLADWMRGRGGDVPRTMLDDFAGNFKDAIKARKARDEERSRSLVAARLAALCRLDGEAGWVLPRTLPVAQDASLVDVFFTAIGAGEIAPNSAAPEACAAALRYFLAALDLAKAFKLSPAELRFALAAPSFFGDKGATLLAAFKLDGAGAKPEAIAAWAGLMEYVALRDDAALSPAAWMPVLAACTDAPAAGSTRMDGLRDALSALTGCAPRDVEDACALLWRGLDPDAPRQWHELQSAVAVLKAVKRTRRTPAVLASWTGLADMDRAYGERLALGEEMRTAARARFGASGWRAAIRPLADESRKQRRDALSAWIVHDKGLADADQLYETYLIDTRMEPAVLTSRLRIAIAAVQLFINRCLLNLEKDSVTPSAIRAEQWAWMKRYRVWEANRKIFLYPENWLEPEFRDDRTHLYRRLENRLLQSDLTHELADSAFFEYARDLETLANLDIVAMTCEQRDDLAANTLHVIGRTHSSPRKYFSRRYALGMWTPWEPLDADIQGDHVVAAFWKDRLHVFWLVFLDSSSQEAPTGSFKGDTGVTLPNADQTRTIRLAWADCIHGEWSTYHASGPGISVPIRPGEAGQASQSASLSINLAIERDAAGAEGALQVNVYQEEKIISSVTTHFGHAGMSIPGMADAFRVISHNAPVTRVPPPPPAAPPTALRNLVMSVNCYTHPAGTLESSFYQSTSRQISPGAGPAPAVVPAAPLASLTDATMLVAPEPLRVTALDAPLRLDGEWGTRLAPFFFSDTSGSYYVEPSRKEETTIESRDWFDWDWSKIFKERGVTPPLGPRFPRLPLPGVPWPGPYPVDPVGPITPENPFGPFNSGDPIGPRVLPGQDGTPSNPLARYGLDPGDDWVTRPDAVVQFGETLLGRRGGSLARFSTRLEG